MTPHSEPKSSSAFTSSASSSSGGRGQQREAAAPTTTAAPVVVGAAAGEISSKTDGAQASKKDRNGQAKAAGAASASDGEKEKEEEVVGTGRAPDLVNRLLVMLDESEASARKQAKRAAKKEVKLLGALDTAQDIIREFEQVIRTQKDETMALQTRLSASLSDIVLERLQKMDDGRRQQSQLLALTMRKMAKVTRAARTQDRKLRALRHTVARRPAKAGGTAGGKRERQRAAKGGKGQEGGKKGLTFSSAAPTHT